jgi:hypothetical protein
MRAPFVPSRRRPGRSPGLAAPLCALLLAALPATVMAQVLAQAIPSQYDLQLEPGKGESRPLYLHNMGRERVKVRLRLADFRMSARGARDLLPAGTLPSTLARHLKFEPAEFELAPGDRQVVRVEMTIPRDGPATRFGVILSRVTAAGPDAANDASVPAELGTTLFLTRAPRSRIRAELVGCETRVSADGTVSLEVRVRNRSERHAPLSGEVKLSDSTGTRRIGGPLAEGVVLPGASRILAWRGDRPLPAGRYVATVTVDAGEPELLVGQKDFVIRPRSLQAARGE